MLQVAHQVVLQVADPGCKIRQKLPKKAIFWLVKVSTMFAEGTALEPTNNGTVPWGTVT